MEVVRSEGVVSKCDKLSSSSPMLIRRSRLQVWLIRICSCILLWTCLIQLVTVGELWHPRLPKSWRLGDSSRQLTRITSFSLPSQHPALPAPPPLPLISISSFSSFRFQMISVSLSAVEILFHLNFWFLLLMRAYLYYELLIYLSLLISSHVIFHDLGCQSQVKPCS